MLTLLSEHHCHGGQQRVYQHHSREIGLPMRFSVYLPPQAADTAVPALFYLAGLTCNEETFMTKAGAQRFAAENGIALIAPDTSPRGANLPGESDNWEMGVGAGFYLDATQAPWSQHYQMYSYIVHELYELVLQTFPIASGKVGIFGHSMGGHGALVLALRNPERFRSVSAFAPIAAPINCPWGHKAFSHYLGANNETWRQYDASALMSDLKTPFPAGILIDQGLKDEFLEEQLLPEAFEAACLTAKQPLTLRRHSHYDHGYYFISSFIADHLAFHTRILGGL